MKYQVLEVGELPKSEGQAWVITPEWASWALEKFNWHNRRRIQSAIERYCNDMRNGSFQLTHQAIAFSTKPVFLIDGQNRLAAIIEYGKPVPIRIFTDQPPETQLVVDDHRIRSVADAFTLTGLPTTSREVAIANAMIVGPNQFRSKTSKSDLRKFMARHGDALRFVESSLPHVRGITASALAAVARAYYHCDHDTLLRFLRTLTSGLPDQNDHAANTALVLRKWLVESNAAHTGAVGKAEVYRKTQRMLRFYIDGDVVMKCTGTDKDLFPLPSD